MEDLCAKIGKLHRFFVGHLWDDEGGGNCPWIGAQDAVDIRPDFDDGSVQRRAEDRRRIVRTIPSDRGCTAILRRSEEARNDWNDLFFVSGELLKVCTNSLIGFLEKNRRPRELLVGHNQMAGIDKLRRLRLPEVSSDDERGESFSKTCREVECPCRRKTKQIDSMQCVLQFVEELINGGVDPFSFRLTNEGINGFLVSVCDPAKQRVIGLIPFWRELRALEKLVRNVLKRRDDNDDALSCCRLEDDLSDVANAIGT